MSKGVSQKNTNILEDNNFSFLFEKYDKIMELKIFIEENKELHDLYKTQATNHNTKLLNNCFLDAGFDLFCPNSLNCEMNSINKINLGIKCSAQIITDTGKRFNTGYYIFPRSSTSKTPLRLANSVGIIDSGYRNNLMVVFDSKSLYLIEEHTRLFQICAPSLVPIYIKLVDKEEDLGDETERNLGGFGSTGI
jgi:dUTP pyrophosphatase